MFLLLVLIGFAAFLVSFTATPFLIRMLKEHDVTGVDVHKAEKPVCAEMGGIAVLLGGMCAFGTTFFFSSVPSYSLVASFLTVFFVGLVGVIDGLFGLRQRQKVFLATLASTPLVLVSVGQTEVWFPFFGTISLGVLYWLLFVPLGVATASNLTNMLAGFNGLEAGIGTIASAGLGVLCSLLGRQDAAVLSFLMFGAFLGFLKYNWYPARVFPGDTGALMSGATIACVSVIGNVEAAAILMLAPAAIDFTLKMVSSSPFSQRKVYGDTKVMGDGTLVPPNYPALCHAFMRVSQINEKELVSSLLLMEAVFTALGIVLTIIFI